MCTVFFFGFKKFLAMYSTAFLSPAVLCSLREFPCQVAVAEQNKLPEVTSLMD